jgi:Mandelate racemase / muconate lactonizing enzyme, N-terminal domain
LATFPRSETAQSPLVRKLIPIIVITVSKILRTKIAMKIVGVEAIRIGEPEWDPSEGWTTSPMDALFDFSEEAGGKPMGVFNGLVGIRTNKVFTVIVRIRTDTGLTGLGGIALGSEAVAMIVERHLQPLVVGESPFNTELIWEKMFRSTINIGRKGLVLEAISGIDIELICLDMPLMVCSGSPAISSGSRKGKPALMAFPPSLRTTVHARHGMRISCQGLGSRRWPSETPAIGPRRKAWLQSRSGASSTLRVSPPISATRLSWA